MSRLEDEMTAFVDFGASILRRLAPSDEHNASRSLLGHGVYDLLGEEFPALLRVAVCLMCADSETRIQQQHTTVGPWCQEAAFIGWGFEVRIVLLKSLIDVEKRWWSGSRRTDGEAQAMGLVVIMVWVLAKDNGFDGGQWGMTRPADLRLIWSSETTGNSWGCHTSCRCLGLEGRSFCLPPALVSETSSDRGILCS